MPEPLAPSGAPSTETAPRNGGGIEHLYGLKPALVLAVAEAARADDAARVRRLIEPLHYSDVADLLERLDGATRHKVVEFAGEELLADAISELDEAVREEVVAKLTPREIAEVVAGLETDDAVEIIEELPPDKRDEVLEEVAPAERAEIEESLSYPEDSAGRMMDSEPVSIPETWTVGETIDHMRESAELPEDFYDIFVTDGQKRLKGTLPLNVLLRTGRPVRVAQIMKTDLVTIPAAMDQEEVARLFRDRDLVSAPVVNAQGRLVGMITVDDVVDVIEEEAEEDMLRLAGVGQEGGIHERLRDTAQSRIRWLAVTLFNTICASLVISQFQATIEKLVALAVLMPIVAAMGGNAGMQVVTVTVRALATKELSPGSFARVVGKEALVGSINGIFFAVIMAVIAGLWFSDWRLSGVLAAAMLFNMIWAGMAGTLIPLTLARFNIDPALAAGPFLTTTTDVLGFFVFLGLASLLLF